MKLSCCLGGIELLVVVAGALLTPSASSLYQNLTHGNDSLQLVLPDLKAGSIKCNERYLGKDLELASCINAWTKIPRDNIAYSYGLRTDIAAGARFDIGLPVRYLSDNGVCAIDIRPRYGAEADLNKGDSAENIEISAAARAVIERCVATRPQGGYNNGFSKKGLLTIAVLKYKPSMVCNQATEQKPYPQFCERILQTMSARSHVSVFALSSDHPPSTRYTLLPKTIDFRESSPCS